MEKTTGRIRKRYSAEQKARLVVEMLKEEQTLWQLSATHGVHPNQMRKWRAQALERLPSVFTDQRQSLRELQAEHERERTKLFAEIGRLTTELRWLKKKVASSFSKAERAALVDWNCTELPLRVQCKLLGLNRSSLYYVPKLPSPEEVALKHRIDEIYTAHPFYGSRRITAVLRRERPINRKAVQR